MIVYKVPQDFLDGLEEIAKERTALANEGRSLIQAKTGLEVDGLSMGRDMLFTVKDTKAPVPRFLKKEGIGFTAKLTTNEGKSFAAEWTDMVERIGFKGTRTWHLFKQIYFNSTYKIDTVQGVKCFVVYEGIDPAKEGWEPMEI